jgi:hypothetical protein
VGGAVGVPIGNVAAVESVWLQIAIGALAGLIAYWTVPTAWAAGVAVCAYRPQRDEARQMVEANEAKHARDFKKEEERHRELEGIWHQTDQDQWKMNDDLRGKLGEAETRIKELQALVPPAPADRPELAYRILSEGDKFWVEITNEGPVEIPDQPLILNMLFPSEWDLRAGGGGFSPSREDLKDAEGTPVKARLWSFKDYDPPVPHLSQTYEFQIVGYVKPGKYPISIRPWGYHPFDALLGLNLGEDEQDEGEPAANQDLG